MATLNEGPCRTFTTGAILAANIRVKLSSGALAAAGLADEEIGTLESASLATSGLCAVRLRTAAGTAKFVCAASVTSGDTVYTAASGKVSSTQGPGSHVVGTALEDGSGDGAVIEVLRCAGSQPDDFVVSTGHLAAADLGDVFFIAPFACQLRTAYETHGVVAGQAGTLTIEKCAAGDAAAAGDVALATAWDLTSTINTPVAAAALTTAAGIMAAGDFLRTKVASGSAASLADMVISVHIERIS